MQFVLGTSFGISWHRLLCHSLVRLVILGIFSCIVATASLHAQPFTHADTLRGTNNENRSWWDVLRYDIEVKPNYEKKEIEGTCAIRYDVVRSGDWFQIDLQQPLVVDEVNFFINFSTFNLQMGIDVIREGNVLLVKNIIKADRGNGILNIQFHGKPIEAVKPPWDGGWIFTKDKLGRPWMSLAVQGLGASAWYPCKDYQGDEPDEGASLTITVPDTLVAVANGRLTKQQITPNTKPQTVSYTWHITSPINNYTITPNIGKYVNFIDTMMGEKGKLDLSYWVLDYNLDKAKQHFVQVKKMLRAFEYWFGSYPFYEDSYKLVDAPFVGMEHQSNIAYGNGYQNGYAGRGFAGSPHGMLFDFMIVHESGHEWFGNSITTKDIADMWVHEAFTHYSEVLYLEYYHGKDIANAYCVDVRKRISNEYPIIGPYGVNAEAKDVDQYCKGANMLQSIRHAMNNDEKFRKILRGLNTEFYHQTVTTKQVEDYFNKNAGFNFQKVFNQYLRTIQIPVLEYQLSTDSKMLSYRWTNCIAGFNLPIVLNNKESVLKLEPTEEWKKIKIDSKQKELMSKEVIEQQYYVATKKVD